MPPALLACVSSPSQCRLGWVEAISQCTWLAGDCDRMRCPRALASGNESSQRQLQRPAKHRHFHGISPEHGSSWAGETPLHPHGHRTHTRAHGGQRAQRGATTCPYGWRSDPQAVHTTEHCQRGSCARRRAWAGATGTWCTCWHCHRHTGRSGWPVRGRGVTVHGLLKKTQKDFIERQ